MHQKYKLLILFFIVLVSGFAQQLPQLSPSSTISVLTTGAGEELYSSFGHSAFRVQDANQGIDVVYNYGIFDMRGENFYFEFSQGRMNYIVARTQFLNYIEGYKAENRWVDEQVLDVTITQRNAIFAYLENNAQPQNRTYAYDYFTNNCATKIWDVLKAVLGDTLQFKEDYITQTFSFRQLYRSRLKTNMWGAFGIDMALGSAIDQTVSKKEHMYLPDYVSKQIAAATLGNKPLSLPKTALVKLPPTSPKINFFSSPLFVFCILLIITILVTYKDFKKNKRTVWLDFTLFLVTGLAGLLLFYLWFLTDHIWTVKNYNILWVFPLNLIVAFLLLKKHPPKWIKKYILGLIALIALTFVLWIAQVQSFTMLIIPLTSLLLVRYLFIYKQLSTKH